DSYRWPLHGRADLYAHLWSGAVATLSRARAGELPTFSGVPRIDERLVICGVRDGATVEAPDGTATPLFVDPATGDRRCAGFWPAGAGWHRLRMGEAVHPFHASGADAHRGLRLAELRDASLRIASTPPRAPAAAGAAAPPVAPGTPWPWFLGWLLLAAMAWWLERSRVGLRAAPGA
ncbi:MAG: carboxypeptidase regulatory-like domain-containing protein, partial [Luteimonas sp.]|nr:carboxypeptidase regulatory-like domain-containing protein [Luteimonas sp.]